MIKLSKNKHEVKLKTFETKESLPIWRSYKNGHIRQVGVLFRGKWTLLRKEDKSFIVFEMGRDPKSPETVFYYIDNRWWKNFTQSEHRAEQD